MSTTRRRSFSWMKKLINPSLRIAVASLEDASEQLDSKKNIVHSGNLLESKISTENIESDCDSEELNIQADLESPESSRSKHYLEHYFRFLHFVGLASFKEFWNKTNSVSYMIHKAFFWLLTILAILDACTTIKLRMVIYGSGDKEDMHKYVVIGRALFNCAKRLYFVTVVSSRSNQVVKIFEGLSVLRETMCGKYQKHKVCIYGVGIGLASLAAAAVQVIFGWVSVGYGRVEEWSPSECILHESLRMSLNLFVWTTNITQIGEELEVLHESYATEFTPVTITLGVLGIVMGSIGTLVDYVVNDIMLFSAMTMYDLSKKFQRDITQGCSTVEDVLKIHKQLQNVSNCINDAFGGLFKAAHASNLLTCANILVILVLESEYDLGLFVLFLQIMKVWKTYYLTVRAAAVNKTFRRWLRNEMSDEERNTMSYDMKIKAFTILDDSLESPLGLGSDTFYMDEIFVLKFATMACTFSLFLIDRKRKIEPG